MSVPAGWSFASIADVTERRVDQRAPSKATRYIDIGSIDRESKRVGDVAFVEPSTAPTRARQWVRAGDVLVSMTRPNLNAVAIVDEQLDGAVASTGFDILRAKGVLPKWLYYRVRSDAFVRDICGGVQGIVYPAVRPADVRRHVLPIPPVPEQARIVEAIESYLSRLDDAVASLRRAQTRLEGYRTSVLKAAVEGRLVPTEAALARAEKRDYEPADVLHRRILAERRRRWEEAELAKMFAAGKPPKDDKWKNRYEPCEAPDAAALPKLPEGWCWSSLGQAFVVTVGATPSRAKPEYWNGTTPWVSSGEVAFCRIKRTRETISAAGLQNSSTKLNPAGSVLLGMIGEGKTRGQAAILDIPACGNQNAAAIWVSETPIPPEYVYHYLVGQYEVTRLRSSGNNQPALNKARVEAIAIPLPPLREQARIVEVLESQLTLIDAIRRDAATQLRRIERLRQSVLTAAFQGKLSDQYSSDEPAEQLLRRIRNGGHKVLSRENEQEGTAASATGHRRLSASPLSKRRTRSDRIL